MPKIRVEVLMRSTTNIDLSEDQIKKLEEMINDPDNYGYWVIDILEEILNTKIYEELERSYEIVEADWYEI